MGKRSKSELTAKVTARKEAILADLSNNNILSNSDLTDVINSWLTDVSNNLSIWLDAAADAGETSYTLESSIFINPGKKADGGITYNNKNIFREDAFHAYITSHVDILTQLRTMVDGTITVTELTPSSSSTPDMPQNIVLRYTFSWA
jgi:hypothetical protein